MTIFAAAHPLLAEALAKRGFATMTDVQLAVLADNCRKSDLLVSAQTGSGKTVAFGLSMADQLLGPDTKNDFPSQPPALIITPTRELALQVKKELDWLYAETGLVLVSAVGGMDIRGERRALSGRVDILIGTPGRLVDHLNRNSFYTDNLQVVVLDEADEMLDMGFREDLETLLKAAPEHRRTLMFSATVPRTIAALARRYQRDAIRVETISAEEQHQDITYRACSVRPSDRQNAIINLLRFNDDKKVVIFCATRASVSYLATRLANRGLSVVALSGELNQAARNQALQAMRDGRARVCVATDVAARGIDLPNLDLVIHADLPRTPDVLLHRSGRTGRAGRKGTAIIIVPENTYRKTQRLLQQAGIKAEWGKAPDADAIRARDDRRIMQNADLTAKSDETEITLQKKLTASFTAEQLALALIRQHRRDLAAPEELGEIGDMNIAGEARTYLWFSLSAGKAQDIHVRGLLSLLSAHGGVKSSDVGDIYLHHAESHVAIAESTANSFISQLKGGHLTEEITVTQINSPTIPKSRDKANRGRKKSSFGQHRKHKSSGWSPNNRKDKPKPKRSGPKKDKPHSKEKSSAEKKPFGKDTSDQPEQVNRYLKGPKKPRKLSQSTKPDRSDKVEKSSKAGQTLTIRKKGAGTRKPKQGGFKPVRRKSPR